jgi:hypothetical protein
VKRILSFLLLMILLQYCIAQEGSDSVSKTTDSTRGQLPGSGALNHKDTGTGMLRDSAVRKASPSARHLADSLARYQRRLYRLVLSQNPYFNFFGKPRYEIAIERSDRGKEGLFYLVTALVLYFALVKLLFSKYIANLLAVFFRVSLKQKQIREQLLQSPLPSLLLNIFFVISGGIYISFLLGYYHFIFSVDKWLIMLYSVIALGIIYLGKFIVLKLMGWIFNISEATDTYIFVVFLVNKLLGVFLIPFLILLAFSSLEVNSIVVALSFTLVAIFFAYRYIISYAPVRKEVKVSQFHFLLYICALEVMPLLLIYKLLLNFLEKSS